MSGRAAAMPSALFGVLLALAAPAGGARADERPVAQERRSGCLNEAEIRDEVAARRIVTQVAALRAARAAAGGEAVRARLCHGEDGLVYAITALKRDGKVLRIDVDAATGRVIDRN
jgi:uncharacterized membrane protein YkoI